MNKSKITIAFIVLSFILFFSEKAFSQESKTDSTFNESSKTFVAVPLINNNPTMKTGFGAMAMYFFKMDTADITSPPSIVALTGLYSTNNSYFFVPMARLFWNENKDRASISTGTIKINNNFNYDFEGQDINLVFSEQRYLLILEYSKKVIGDFYMGMLYLGTKTLYKFDQGSDEQNEFTREFFEQNNINDNFISSLGLNLSFDNRDYPYYPTRGASFSVRPKLNAAWLGSDNNYVDTDYAFKYYKSLAKNKILAFSVAGGFATGDVPFDGYQNYGLRNNLRGYTTGKYKGRNMIAYQAEYRWQFYKRWGAVAFAGSGRIWGTDKEDVGEKSFEKLWLPSLGGGFRFMVSKEKRINLRLDYAWGG